MFPSKEITLKPAKTEPACNGILSHMGKCFALTEDTIDKPAKTENCLKRLYPGSLVIPFSLVLLH